MTEAGTGTAVEEAELGPQHEPVDGDGSQTALRLDQGDFGEQRLPDRPSLRLEASWHFGTDRPRKWLEIAYRQAFTSQPVRHLLRFVSTSGAETEYVLPAATFGRAHWIGIVPAGSDGFEIWSYAKARASFRIERVDQLTSPELALRIAVRNPGRLPAFVLSLIRSGERTQMLRALTALEFHPMTQFARLARSRSRPVDDQDLVYGPAAKFYHDIQIDFLIAFHVCSKAALHRTLKSLNEQADRQFRVRLVVGDTYGDLGDLRSLYSGLTLVLPCDANRVYDRETDIWIAEIKPGDVLAPEAVLALRGFISDCEDIDVVYTDHAVDPGGGQPVRPKLKPDWSPSFFENSNYIERLCLVRIRRGVEMTYAPPLERRVSLDEFLRSAPPRVLRIEHLKRVLLTTPTSDASEVQTRQRRRATAPRQHSATVIIPTRDKFGLLQTAIESLRSDINRNALQIIIVDNGSTETDCLRYLEALEDRESIVVLKKAGAFNFSALINAGAARATGDVLILFNNDCAVLHSGWLEAMTALAAEADVGAVGARLLYDNGTLQHAGVGIGLGGEAGHRNRGASADFPGYLDRLRYVHEVSAVTAACLAVQRSKFSEIGGFDEAFAVAFNDIDFCLRLRARGYRNLFTPHATLRHSESMSRGSDRHRDQHDRWSGEAALFRKRWQHVILDDPYMHPLFSLWRFQEVLQ